MIIIFIPIQGKGSTYSTTGSNPQSTLNVTQWSGSLNLIQKIALGALYKKKMSKPDRLQNKILQALLWRRLRDPDCCYLLRLMHKRLIGEKFFNKKGSFIKLPTFFVDFFWLRTLSYRCPQKLKNGTIRYVWYLTVRLRSSFVNPSRDICSFVALNPGTRFEKVGSVYVIIPCASYLKGRAVSFLVETSYLELQIQPK